MLAIPCSIFFNISLNLRSRRLQLQETACCPLLEEKGIDRPSIIIVVTSNAKQQAINPY